MVGKINQLTRRGNIKGAFRGPQFAFVDDNIGTLQ